MAISQVSEVIQHLRRAVLLRDGLGLTDGQLLEDFISRRDEAALAALVRRHGPMVWGVCRRVLRNYHDAEDAFQATFLVLVRKAARVVPRAMVANWLYGVAYHTALKAGATAARRRARERQVIDMPEPEVVEQDRSHHLQLLLDQELSCLPDKYRVVILLCDLEGKTRKEAARQLDLPEGTVAGQLARARTMLAKRLARHGLVLSGGALAALLSQKVAAAGVPTSTVSSTIKAATLYAAGQAAATGVISAQVAALTEGVLKSMLLTKLKTMLVLIGMPSIMAIGLSFFAYYGFPQQSMNENKKEPIKLTAQEPASKDADKLDEKTKINREEAIKDELQKLEGTWLCVSFEFNGEKLSEEDAKKVKLVLQEGSYEYTFPDGQTEKGTIQIDPNKKPKTFDVTPSKGPASGKTFPGIYELDGNSFKYCMAPINRERPTELVSEQGRMHVLVSYKREKPSQEPAAARAVDYDKIERGLAKEPAYQTKSPAYALLLFGPEARLPVWVVLDGEVLYLDRNGNGDLTEGGERFDKEADCKDLEIADPDGKTKYVIKSVRSDYSRFTPTARRKRAAEGIPPQLMVTVEIKGPVGYRQYCDVQQMRGDLRKAMIAHFHGPLTIGPPTANWKLAQSVVLRSGKEPGELYCVIGTMSEKHGCWVVVQTEEGDKQADGTYKCTFPEGVRPVAQVEFPPKEPGGAPVKRRYDLNKFC